MAETGTSISHCPTSQQFLGSGTMPWQRTVAAGVTISVGSDFGGGDEWLISRVLGDSFKVHISEAGDDSVALHPAELLFTGTLAGARALDMEDRGGNFDVGKEADFIVVDPSKWPPLAAAIPQCRDAPHGCRVLCIEFAGPVVQWEQQLLDSGASAIGEHLQTPLG